MDETKSNDRVSSTSSSTAMLTSDELLTMQDLDQHLMFCRRLNTRLDVANQHTTSIVNQVINTTATRATTGNNNNNKPISTNPVNDSSSTNLHKSTRLLVFMKWLLNDGPLMNIYTTLTSSLTSGAARFAVDLGNIEDNNDDLRNIECERVVKMVKTNVELARLVVELTSPAEMLRVNRAAVYSVLTPFEVADETQKPQSQSQQQQQQQSRARLCDYDSDSADEDCRILNQKDYAVYLLTYKDLFVRADMFATLCDNLLASLRLIHALSDFEVRVIMSAKRRGLVESRLRYLLVHLVDAILINLCMARNLLIEKNESLLNLIIARFLDNKFDQVVFFLFIYFVFVVLNNNAISI